jgi:hypothetical protein
MPDDPCEEREKVRILAADRELDRILAETPTPAISPLDDHHWIAEFRRYVKLLLATARDLKSCVEMPEYYQETLRTRWHPALEGLWRHLWKIKKYAREYPEIEWRTPLEGVGAAVWIAMNLLDEIGNQYRATRDRNTVHVAPLERIDELLDQIHQRDEKAADPGELAKLGYIPMTVRDAAKTFDVSVGSAEQTGSRAQNEGKILDYKVIRGKLWVLPKEHGHLGT